MRGISYEIASGIHPRNHEYLQSPGAVPAARFARRRPPHPSRIFYSPSLRAKRSNLKCIIVIASEAKQSQKYYSHNNYEIASCIHPRNHEYLHSLGAVLASPHSSLTHFYFFLPKNLKPQN
jgi:hypothetical protein